MPRWLLAARWRLSAIPPPASCRWACGIPFGPKSAAAVDGIPEEMYTNVHIPRASGGRRGKGWAAPMMIGIVKRSVMGYLRP
jgi:hypothetical protein